MASYSPTQSLVFVHGFDSHSGVWDSVSRLFREDPALGVLSQARYSYPTSKIRLNPLKSIPDLDILAESFRVWLDTQLTGSSEIVIFAHSQGGLLVQRYLARMVRQGAATELQRIRQISLMACPNTGSDLFLTLRRGLLGSRHPQERHLRPLDASIAGANSDVMRRVVNATELTANQCPIRMVAFAGEEDGIVKIASAHASFPETRVIPGDHSSLIQPDGREDTRFLALRGLVVDALSSTEEDESRPRKVIPGDDRTEFVAELTVPDGSILEPGEIFEKVWIIRNAGSVAWRGRSLRRMGGGYALGLITAPETVSIPDTEPGEEVRISVTMRAPRVAAFTTCLYKMVDSTGQLCFPDSHPAGLSSTIQVNKNEPGTYS